MAPAVLETLPGLKLARDSRKEGFDKLSESAGGQGALTPCPFPVSEDNVTPDF